MIAKLLQQYLTRRELRFVPLLLLVLVAIVSALLNYWNMQGNVSEMARYYAQGIVRLMVDSRTWNAEHGGVYVPVSERTRPNPYLKVANRDLMTVEGLALTMINPAYMTRQIGEVTNRQVGLRTHITSLRPVNPLNEPDAWERDTLEAFARENKESRLELLSSAEGTVFRYMIPLWIEPACLRCHAEDGYKSGDLRGGISVTFPAETHLAIFQSQKNMMLLWHLLGFMAAATVLSLLLNHLRRQWREMEQMLAEREQTIAQRTASLAKESERYHAIAQKLEHSNKELRDFAYIASHDLQEPLRTIVSFGDRLMLKHADHLDERGRDYLERIQAAALRMRSLIEELLNYSRVSSREQKFVQVDLDELLKEVLEDLSQRLTEGGGRVEIVNPLGTITADRSQMHRLLLNLIGNALKFQRQGVSPLVRVSRHELPGQRLEVVVEDNGIGFDEKYLDRIFRPFQRLHLRGHYPGTGMGLAICKKIVERHQGQLIAGSVPEQGTTFRIILPG